MKKLSIRNLLILGGVILPILTMLAQEKKAVLPAEVMSLHRFVGKWSCTVNFTDEKKVVSKFISSTDFRLVSGGYGVIGYETINDPKMGNFHATYLLGFDPYDKKIHFYVVDNKDICHDHDCEWKSPDHFYVEHTSMRDGKKYQEKADLVFKDKDTMEYTETDYLNGAVTGTASGTYKKVK